MFGTPALYPAVPMMGPASFVAVDPDGNPIYVDQHV
jgi:hypothetical protein